MFAFHKRYINLFVGVIVALTLIITFVGGVGLLDNVQWGWNLTSASSGSLIMGDINTDNRTDFILTGDVTGTAGPYIKVYINNGSSLEENNTWQWNLTEIYLSGTALGDIDNDGDLDLVSLGDTTPAQSGGEIAKVHINNGTSFIESNTWQGNLTGGAISNIILGDINLDGRLDLIVGRPKFRIYLNNGSSFNENINWEKNIQNSLSIGVGDGAAECINLGDYDNDGDLDLVEAGHDGGDPRNKLFKNNGTSFVLDIDELTSGLQDCNVAFGDIDNDGDLDLIQLGAFFAVADTTLFINVNGTLSGNATWSQGLTDTKEGTLAFGDYNNDGKLDLFLTGNYIAQVYNNTGSNFTQDSIFGINLTGITYSSVIWNDIDNDGDLDSILSGYWTTDSYLTKIYISNASLYRNNSLPYSPSTFQNYSLANGNIFLGWNNGSDSETISLGLYYNLRVGTTSGGNDIVSGVFGSASGSGGGGGGAYGYFGNMMQRRNISLAGSRFSVGTTYYWSVQTIDTGLAKSAWSTEQTFTLTSDFTPPVVTLNAPSGVTNQTLNIVFNATVYDDYNLTNVSLYGNWSGWHINITNASGINNTDYIFKANLTEGEWLWGIRACDATNNCRGSNSTFRIDITYPIVALVSPANGTSQTSSNAVTFTYNVSDVVINNCTLYLNGVANETDNSITVSTSQTFTENVPNGAYNWSVRCADAANNINTSGNYSLTISYTPSETPASTSGGGGGGSGGGSTAAVLTKVTRIIAAITEGNNIIEFAESEKAAVGIEEIMLDSATAASNVKITIEKLTAMPASVVSAPSGEIYTYLQFNKTVLKDEDVKEAKIKFRVDKAWIAKNAFDMNKVALNRYKTAWEALPTRYIRQNGTYYYYESTTPGFSVFAITAEKKQEEPLIITEKANKTEEKPEIPAEEAPKVPEKAMKRLISPAYLVLIGIIIITLVIIVLFRKKKKR